jgi:uncharacterized protein
MPAADRPVVLDTGPIIALAGIGRLDLLRALYREVLIPPAVRHELTRGEDRPGSRRDLHAAPWIKVATAPESEAAALLTDLDRGEAEAIALARKLQPSLLVIDDRLGRRHATRLALTFTGTIGVLVVARERGLVERVSPLLNRLAENGIYVSQRLRDWVRD